MDNIMSPSVKFGIIGATIGITYAFIYSKLEDQYASNLLGVKIEKLCEHKMLFDYVKRLQSFKYYDEKSYNQIVIMLDSLVTLRTGVFNMHQNDKQFFMDEKTMQRAYAFYDQSRVYIDEFIRSCRDIANPGDLVKIHRLCTNINREIHSEWKNILSFGRNMF
jgi:uncharacterized membrane protein